MNRVKSKINQIYMQACYISINLAFWEFVSSITTKNVNSIINKKSNYKKHEAAKHYIRKQYKNVIEKYRNERTSSKKIEPNCRVWIFWWQGEKSQPNIVKNCINSVRNNMPNHELITIDKYNIDKFLNIPKEIMKKVDEGSISLAGFSDYVRFSLLSRYGGLWIDSTVFLSGCIDDMISQYSFFSIKHGIDKETHVCKGLWMVSVLGCGVDSKIFRFCQELMEEILLNEKFNITYLLVDCIIAIAYEEYDDVRTEIDMLKTNNELYIYLDHNIEKPIAEFPAGFFDKQKIHKLSYKAEYNYREMPVNSAYSVLIKGT